MASDLTIEDAYREWADDLVRYATVLVGPSDAADLVADAFASVLARGHDSWVVVLEPRRYLFRSVLNVARMRERGRRRRERREVPQWHPPVDGGLLYDPSIQRAVGALSVQQRAAIYLAYWEDLRPADVAAILHISEGAVRRQLARARSSLREVLS